MKNFITLSYFLLLSNMLLVTSCKNKAKDKHEDETTDWIKAQELEFMQTADPATNTVPFERLIAANTYAKGLMQTENINALNWQERGPNNIGGRTRAILISKLDATGNTVFVGSVGGGLWKTTNFKSSSTTWTAVNDFSSNPAISSLAQDPSNNNIIYAGTGEGFAGLSETFNNSGQRGNGIFKSVDGGNTWSVLASTVGNQNFAAVNKIVVDITGKIYTANSGFFCNRGGIYKSSNGGTTWDLVVANTQNITTCSAALNCFGADVEIAANGDIYASTKLASGGGGKLWKSSFDLNGTNTGNLNTFVDVTPTNFAVDRIEIGVAPSDGNRVYLVTEAPTGTSNANGLFSSTDGGTNWTSLTVPVATANGSVGYNFARGQAFYNLIIAVDPGNADKFIIGGIDLLRTSDAGVSFQQISVWSGFQIPAPLTNAHIVHADQHNVVYNGSNEAIFGNDGGLVYATNLQSTSLPSYTNKNLGYNVTQFYSCAIHPTLPNYIIAGAQDNGTVRINNPGLGSGSTILGGDGMMCYIDQTDGQFQIGSYVNLNYRISKNNGTNWTNLTTSNGDNRGLFVNPGDYDNIDNIYYGADNSGSYIFFDMDDAVPTITSVAQGDIIGRQITAIKAIPGSTSNEIWIGTRTTSGTPQIFKLTNANNPGTVFGNTPTGFTGVTSGYISNIDVHPTNANRILVTLSNYGINNVWESTDGGVTLNPIDGNLPDMPIRWGMYMRNNALLGTGTQEGGIILGTEVGVWTTSTPNGPSTIWIPNNLGFSNVSVRQLTFRPSDNTLVAATHGRGVFTSIVPFSTTRINNATNTTKGFINNTFYSNGSLQVFVGKLNNVKKINIELYNSAGQRVIQNQTNYQNTTINTAQLSKGLYNIRITSDNKYFYSNKIVL